MKSAALGLVKELFDHLSNCRVNQITTFTVLPDELYPYNESKFLHVNETAVDEIICSKSTYLNLFCEGRQFLNSESSKNGNYLATFCILSVTPEDRKVLLQHENLVLRRLRGNSCNQWKADKVSQAFFQIELQAITLLLTCSVNRVNKSSSLWLYFRKLYVLAHELFPSIIVNHSGLFLQSASRHASNYYCWNTFRWIYDLQIQKTKDALLDTLWKFCFSHSMDSSSWWALGHALLGSTDLSQLSIEDYSALRAKLNLPKHDKSYAKLRLASETTGWTCMQKIVTFIDSAEVRHWPAFGCLARLLPSLDLLSRNQLLEGWSSAIQKFEGENFKIDERSITKAIYGSENDLLLQRSLETLQLKKKYLISTTS
ncbi:LADA_0G11474g1_1 [Lachancea dasiensis]|uniref:LADA_0G11474g1_1 n=1 Tax=Lachancea dasiensis TaxID=1072105 RepID=A0A1G4JV88_9SACH|nr:LADA_0G11474g1_1 [Lachancea dasiensis]